MAMGNKGDKSRIPYPSNLSSSPSMQSSLENISSFLQLPIPQPQHTVPSHHDKVLQSSKSHGDLTATRLKTKELAQDVQDAVEEDLSLHYRVTDSDTIDSLNRLLPVEKTKLDAILEHMKVLYDSKIVDGRVFQTPHARKVDEETQGERVIWRLSSNCGGREQVGRLPLAISKDPG